MSLPGEGGKITMKRKDAKEVIQDTDIMVDERAGGTATSASTGMQESMVAGERGGTTHHTIAVVGSVEAAGEMVSLDEPKQAGSSGNSSPRTRVVEYTGMPRRGTSSSVVSVTDPVGLPSEDETEQEARLVGFARRALKEYAQTQPIPPPTTTNATHAAPIGLGNGSGMSFAAMPTFVRRDIMGLQPSSPSSAAAAATMMDQQGYAHAFMGHQPPPPLLAGSAMAFAPITLMPGHGYAPSQQPILQMPQSQQQFQMARYPHHVQQQQPPPPQQQPQYSLNPHHHPAFTTMAPMLVMPRPSIQVMPSMHHVVVPPPHSRALQAMSQQQHHHHHHPMPQHRSSAPLPTLPTIVSSAPLLRPQSQMLMRDDSEPAFRTGHWDKDEHNRFVQGFRIYGRDWKQLAIHVGTRSKSQVRSHFQKWESELEDRRVRTSSGDGEDTGGDSSNNDASRQNVKRPRSREDDE